MKNPKDLLNLFSSLTNDNSENLIYRVLPHFVAELARTYFRLQVEGTENIPRRGPAIIAPNHSGYSGFDALLLAHEIKKSTGRIPRVLTHHLWFATQATAVPAEKFGFIEATTSNATSQLNKNNLVILFPEGERGNFKPSAERYHLQEFKRGFIRLAIQRQCPIIPTLVIGAEETHINLAQLKLSKYLPGLILPLPLNIIPLPAKWKIVFLQPIELPYKPEAADDRELVAELASEIKENMQKQIRKELEKRGSAFFS